MFQTTNQKINGKERDGPGFYHGKWGVGWLKLTSGHFPMVPHEDPEQAS